MSNAPHTKGPWKFEEAFDDDTSCGIVIRSATDEIAQINSIGVTDFENAALLAAAPELLASLRECRDIMDSLRYFVSEGAMRMVGAHKAVRDADYALERSAQIIARAEGKS